MTNTSHESYLRPFFLAMNLEFKNKWCVLHSYENLPFFSDSDVDMAFSDNDINKLERLITNIASENGWQLYQKLWYDVKHCFYYVLKKNNEDVFLAIDFLIDNDGIGKYGFKTNLLTQNCNWHHDIIPIPNHEIACCYKLIKRIVKKRSLEEDVTYIRNHLKLSDPKIIESILSQHFDGKEKALLINFLNDDNNVLSLQKIIHLHNSRRKFISTIRGNLKYIYWETLRICNRIKSPSGLVVNVPDLDEKQLVEFKNLLSNKVSILFRFVNLKQSSSFLVKFKSLTGSTLLICPQNKYSTKKALNGHWLYPKNMEVNIPKEVTMGQSIEEMTNVYHIAILNYLSNRFN